MWTNLLYVHLLFTATFDSSISIGFGLVVWLRFLMIKCYHIIYEKMLTLHVDLNLLK